MANGLKAVKFSKEEAQSVFDELSRHYRVVAPMEKPGEGRLSDTDLVTYDEVKSFDQIEFSKQTFFSAKSVVFPLRETMFTFQKNKREESNEEMLPTIIFLRSCDIHAMEVIDIHFLEGNDLEDPYYEKRREKIKFFLIECCESFENCYCVSLGTNKTENYSAFMRKNDHGYEIRVKDKELEEYFPSGGGIVKEPRFVEKNMRSVEIPGQIDVSLFEDDIWKEYSLRCIACGRCNTSCPTCTCFSVQDILSEDENALHRRRIWSSCHVKNFALLAGNHDFRIKNGDRMRYRTLHKIMDFNKRNGRQMCTGCGRCDDVCPVYISMFLCVDKINKVMHKREKDE
ncbi:MAG: anaerobic sulfite reductase subunit AsrA [Candidatus Omnitrophota bacterium]